MGELFAGRIHYNRYIIVIGSYGNYFFADSGDSNASFLGTIVSSGSAYSDSAVPCMFYAVNQGVMFFGVVIFCAKRNIYYTDLIFFSVFN